MHLLEELDRAYADGHGLSCGTKLFRAICFFRPELRKLQAAATMRWGLEVAMVQICKRPFLEIADYRAILRTSCFGADTLSGVLAVMVYTHFVDDSGSESS